MYISIGTLIKFFRQIAKLSQEQLAEILQCTPRGLSKIENGGATPRAYTIKQFEDYFHVKISRYYQVDEHASPLKTYEIMVKTRYAIWNGDHKLAYTLARELEKPENATDDSLMLSAYAKADFFLFVAEDFETAIKCCAEGLSREPYVDFSPAPKSLTIDSLMPSGVAMELIIIIGVAYMRWGDYKTAFCIFESFIKTLRNILNEPILLNFFYDILNVRSATAMCYGNLGEAYYLDGRYSDALECFETINEEFAENLSSAWYDTHFKTLYALKRYDESIDAFRNILFSDLAKRDNKLDYINKTCEEYSADYPKAAKQIAAIRKNMLTVYGFPVA